LITTHDPVGCSGEEISVPQVEKPGVKEDLELVLTTPIDGKTL